ncbi:MAG: spiro-SPASM protein [Spirochaetaceae bacterium]|nr:spiro-SPASM protein [Spirochaetaceae bacterium]
MGNLAIINITGLSPLAYQPVLGGRSAFERILEWGSSIPGASGIVFLAGPETPVPEGMRVIRQEKWTEETLIEALTTASRLPAGDNPEDNRAEALFYVWGDSPLMDSEVTATLWKLHYKYDAEYSFADGYPYGLAPEIISTVLPEKLMALAKGRIKPMARDSIFEVLRQDMNAFDVETHLSPKDLRMDRVSITCDTRRNVNIAERLYTAGGIDAETLCRIIPEKRVLLRDRPAFFPIQITDHCPQACSYCPFPKSGGDPRIGKKFMDTGKFEELCGKIVDFAGDAVIGLSLWGEPASHPDIGGLIRGALAAGTSVRGISGPPLTRVLIETSGIGWDAGLLEELAAETDEGRLIWIVSLDAADPELYLSLRGEGQDEAENTARYLTKLFGSYCWLQAVRMEENEEHLEDFYKKWNEEGFKVIIQKYDSYAAFLPQRQPADLSPLERFPCWHLKRDMPVLIDGSVPICRDDLGRRDVLGNVFKDDLETLWNAGDALHRKQAAGESPGPCADCDEYYTFNF